MELELNELIFEKNMREEKVLLKKRCCKIENTNEIRGITAFESVKSGFYSDKNSFIMFILSIIFINCLKFPKCFLEILVYINLLVTNIPEAFGEFWSIIKMNFID